MVYYKKNIEVKKIKHIQTTIPFQLITNMNSNLSKLAMKKMSSKTNRSIEHEKANSIKRHLWNPHIQNHQFFHLTEYNKLKKNANRFDRTQIVTFHSFPLIGIGFFRDFRLVKFTVRRRGRPAHKARNKIHNKIWKKPETNQFWYDKRRPLAGRNNASLTSTGTDWKTVLGIMYRVRCIRYDFNWIRRNRDPFIYAKVFSALTFCQIYIRFNKIAIFTIRILRHSTYNTINWKLYISQEFIQIFL